jgi:hypothetical protein
MAEWLEALRAESSLLKEECSMVIMKTNSRV